MTRVRVAVLGASGFAGAELIRRIVVHPELELVRVCADDHVGEPLERAHPHLTGRTRLVFEHLPPREAVTGVDVVMMGLPHDVSLRVVEAARESSVRLVDLSGSFRLRDPDAYRTYYGRPHPAPELLDQFVYGLPERHRERIRGARWVASPGCFATAITLGLLPFAAAGLLPEDVHTVAMTGSSGAGSVPSPTTHHPVRANNLRVYRPLQHQHTPEVEHELRAAGAPALRLSFVPVSAPLTRGILATSLFRVPGSVSPERLSEVLRVYYAAERFVRVPEARLPEVVAVAGSNFAEVGVHAGDVSGGGRTVTVVSALDNLIKGGAGQAIQNLNLMLGFPESSTLEDPGPYP
ncbi:MAG TPA: N-acetyl-gamma-glutamyl-phosphate reductase [Polyangiaceae bacterium]